MKNLNNLNKKQNILFFLLTIFVFMIGLTYGSVPLYQLFCQLTGYGGTVKTNENLSTVINETKSVNFRKINIKFEGNVAEGLQWKFKPIQSNITVIVGEAALTFYNAENLTNQPIVGVSSYNVTPQKAGIYFNKIQCFCFEEQILKPQELVNMPVFFFIDPDINNDSNMDDITTITLSYTFFKV